MSISQAERFNQLMSKMTLADASFRVPGKIEGTSPPAAAGAPASS